jgi:glucosamine-6-phosphate deaminase
MYLGVERKNINFLEMPFYDTGKSEKKPLSEKDIGIVKELLVKVEPDIVYAGIMIIEL